MKISGTTSVTGLFGFPVEHSLSPAMHNAAFEYLDMDWCYVTFQVRPELLQGAVQAIRALNLMGVNVTVPHKERVIGFLDEVHEEASFIGAVNTIRNVDGRLTGFNTDGRGFIESLAEAGISPAGKSVLVVGAGGACRAISYYLSAEADRLFLYDIDDTKVRRLVSDLGTIRTNITRRDGARDLEDIDILINATPLGLKDADPLPVDPSLLRKDMVVCDLLYRKTPLLKAASAKGCRTLDGLGMLLHQGVLAFEIWTGVRPPVAVMRNAITGFRR